MKTYIFYHGNCFDGFGAAFAAWKKFGNDAVYIPCNYGSPNPQAPKGSQCFMIDFSLKREAMIKFEKEIVENGGSLEVIDHHKTAENDLKGLDFAHFDMTKSGALLAWEYFHPTENVPSLIKYISDHDLWKHELPASKEIHAGLATFPFDFKIWDEFIYEPGIAKLANIGEVVLKYRETLVDMICNQAFETVLDGHKIICVNSTSHWSEVGANLLKKYPEATFAASFFFNKDGNKIWSLRSREGFDVSLVAIKMGGGGHPQAAGFTEYRSKP